jgi:hypothetical protein
VGVGRSDVALGLDELCPPSPDVAGHARRRHLYYIGQRAVAVRLGVLLACSLFALSQKFCQAGQMDGNSRGYWGDRMYYVSKIGTCHVILGSATLTPQFGTSSHCLHIN